MSKKDCIMKGYDIEATNALLSNGMAEDIDDDVSSINLKKEESFVHMQDEHTYNPLVRAGSLEVNQVVYDGSTNHRLRVIDVKDGNNSWTKTITWKDLEDNRIFTTNPGVNALFELKVEGDKEFEVDDDIELEFHPIDTYFENFTEDMDSVTNEEIRLDIVNNAIDALHDMGYDDDFIGDYVHIEVKDTEDGRIKVEVRGEFNYEELSELSDRLNKVVSKYDKYAYFDMEDSGIASAYILKDQSDYVVSEEVVKAFAELIDACETREDLKKVYTEHIRPSVENDVINTATLDEILNIFDKKLDAFVADETKLDESKSIKESDETTPYTKEEVEKELKSITHNFTDKKGELKCGFEEEKNFCVEILKQHYNVVEVSGDDRREGTWYHISFAKPKLNEELEKTGKDGWGDEVEDILDDVFDKIYKIAYEVKHTVRGVYVNGKKVEDLADELKGIKDMLDDAIDELEDNAERINESTPNVSEKLNTSTKTFSQWFDETQRYDDDEFYPFSNYAKTFESAAVLKDATAMDIVKNAHKFYDVYPVDSSDREKAFLFASKELGIKYDDLYDAWLSDTPVKLGKYESINESRGNDEVKNMTNDELETV